MAANKGMVAGSHKRNEFVMIQHDGDAPAAVRAPSPSTPPSLLRVPFATATCRAPCALSVDLGRGRWFRCVTLGVRPNCVRSCGSFQLLMDYGDPSVATRSQLVLPAILELVGARWTIGLHMANCQFGSCHSGGGSLQPRSIGMQPRGCLDPVFTQ